jgi:hypothetical protein
MEILKLKIVLKMNQLIKNIFLTLKNIFIDLKNPIECTNEQLIIIKNAQIQAIYCLKRVINALQLNDLSTKILYKTWFGEYTENRYLFVLNTYRRILKKLEQKNLKYTCSCNLGKNLFGYTYPWNLNLIHICPGFFKANETGSNTKVGILIHETSHLLFLYSAFDIQYGQEESKQLAKKHPYLAIRNADNYEYFLEKLILN